MGFKAYVIMENKDTLQKFLFDRKNKIPLFSLLNEKDIQQIAPYLEVVAYSDGSIIMNEGDPADFISIIISGSIEVKKNTEFKGRQIVLAKMKEGAAIGHMSLVNEKPLSSAATIGALEDSMLIILKREKLESLIQNHPDIGIKILKGLYEMVVHRLRYAGDRLTGFF